MTGIRRILVLLAGTTGLLALLGEAAHAGMNLQHCEPVVES